MSASVSVVVATRDRPAALARCLTGLAWQTAKRLDVVVVDDGSTRADAVPAVVARAFDASAGAVRVLDGGGRGPAAARNLGVRAAAGDVVCFVDDDCVAEPRWAELLAAACRTGGAAAGTTTADPVAGRAAAASQLVTRTLQLASLDRGTLRFAPTCNLACHAELARALPFDESFALAAGEDRDWCARLVAAGEPLRYVPQAVVEHRPQMGLIGLVRQQARYGRGAVRFRGAGEGRRLSGRAFYARLAREAAAAGPAVATMTLVAQIAVAAGVARETLAARGASAAHEAEHAS